MTPSLHLTRRQTLKAAGVALGATLLPAGAGAVGAPSARAATAATLTPELTEGPYWVNTMLRRSNVRANISGSSHQKGVPLDLYINVRHHTTAKPINDLAVDIWHANAYGIYSDESSQAAGGGDSSSMEDTAGQNFLRGYQITGKDKGLADAPVDGQVSFETIWPGWYTSRAIHIHVRVRRLHSTARRSPATPPRSSSPMLTTSASSRARARTTREIRRTIRPPTRTTPSSRRRISTRTLCR